MFSGGKFKRSCATCIVFFLKKIIETMTPKEFFDKVSRMRKAQKEYFRTRSGRALSDSKRLEQEIDAEIERVNKVMEEKQNPKMKF